MSIRLHEEKVYMRLEWDEAIASQAQPVVHHEINWDSDPMEILMAKQELERLELEAELATHH